MSSYAGSVLLKEASDQDQFAADYDVRADELALQSEEFRRDAARARQSALLLRQAAERLDGRIPDAPITAADLGMTTEELDREVAISKFMTRDREQSPTPDPHTAAQDWARRNGIGGDGQ